MRGRACREGLSVQRARSLLRDGSGRAERCSCATSYESGRRYVRAPRGTSWSEMARASALWLSLALELALRPTRDQADVVASRRVWHQHRENRKSTDHQALVAALLAPPFRPRPPRSYSSKKKGSRSFCIASSTRTYLGPDRGGGRRHLGRVGRLLSSAVGPRGRGASACCAGEIESRRRRLTALCCTGSSMGPGRRDGVSGAAGEAARGPVAGALEVAGTTRRGLSAAPSATCALGARSSPFEATRGRQADEDGGTRATEEDGEGAAAARGGCVAVGAGVETECVRAGARRPTGTRHEHPAPHERQ